MLIKLIVRMRHALMTYPQQSYDVSVHVYTYTKHVILLQILDVLGWPFGTLFTNGPNLNIA